MRGRRSLLSFTALLVLAILLWPLPGAFAAVERGIPEGPVNIVADRITYTADEDIFDAAGAVEITFTGGFLKGDRVTVNRGTNQAWAEGNVVLQSGGDRLAGERLFFNLISKTGTLHDGRMFIAENHLYVQGERIEKRAEATYRLQNGSVTSCDGETPDWRIAGREMDLTVDGYGTIKHGRFLARDLPVLYLPYFVFPAKTTRQSGLLFPQFNYSRDKNGLDIEVPFYWAISESADATFYQRYLSQRGYKQGVEFRYHPTAETFGTLYADFLRDRKRFGAVDDKDEAVGGVKRIWQEDQNRWSYYLNHQTILGAGFAFRSDIHRVSDRWYFRDFAAYNYYTENYSLAGQDRFRRVSFGGNQAIAFSDSAALASLASTARLTKDWSLYNLSALARFTDDFSLPNNTATLQKYPEVILTGFRQPLSGTRLQSDFTTGYTHFYRHTGQKGHLWELNPNLYLPLNLGPLQVTPQAGFRASVWERTDNLDGVDKHGDREVFQFGGSASTEIGRVFNIGIGGIEKIRHAIKPEIIHTFIPEASQGHLPDFLTPLPPQHTVTYAVTNTLISRVREKGGSAHYQEMMRLLLSQTYDIRESRRDVAAGAAERRPFGIVNLELDLKPFRYFSLAARNLYNVNAGVWTQTNYDLTVSDHRGDSATLGYRYTQGSVEELNLYLTAAVTPALQLMYVLRNNLLDRRTIESTVRAKYQKQCWIFELTVADSPDDRAVMFYLSLLGIGM
jgi:LPS-assembly protein